VTVDVEIPDINHIFQKPSWCGWEVTADERLKNSTLQDEKSAYVNWKNEQKEWYQSLMVGDGVSVYPTGVSEKKDKKPSFWKRIRKAWKILRGREDNFR